MGYSESTGGRKAVFNPIADDGNEYKFCSTCAFGSVCVGHGVDKIGLTELHCLVEHAGPFRVQAMPSSGTVTASRRCMPCVREP
jgi:hypothetical protein